MRTGTMDPPSRGDVTRENTKQHAKRLLDMIVEGMLTSGRDKKCQVSLKSCKGVISAKVTTTSQARDGMQVEALIDKIIDGLTLPDCHDEVNIALDCHDNELTADVERITPYRWHIDP